MDESAHCSFGIDLINQLKLEQPELWTTKLHGEIQDMMREGVRLEYAYAEDTMPRGVLGMNKESFLQYLQFIANRRLELIGVEPIYANTENPFPWMSEVIDLKKEKNFFETRVTDYQTGTQLDWE